MSPARARANPAGPRPIATVSSSTYPRVVSRSRIPTGWYDKGRSRESRRNRSMASAEGRRAKNIWSERGLPGGSRQPSALAHPVVVLVRSKQRHRQPEGVDQVRGRIVVPRVADRLRIRNVRAGHQHGCAIDFRRGRDVLAVGTCDLKARHRTIAAGFQGAASMVEPDPERVAL